MWLSAQDSDEAELLPVSTDKLPFFQSKSVRRSVLTQMEHDEGHKVLHHYGQLNTLDLYFTLLTAIAGKTGHFV